MIKKIIILPSFKQLISLISLLILQVFLLLQLNCYAEENLWDWAISATGNGSNSGSSILNDNYGNSYVAGTFQGEITFGSQSLSTNDYNSGFIAKINKNGEWLWIKQISSSDIWNLDTVFDTEGNICVSGNFKGKATFGSIPLVGTQKMNIFVAKLDKNGNWLWAEKATGNIANEGITKDNIGNLYITGFFYGSLNFGNRVIKGSFGSIYVAKISQQGNWQNIYSPKGEGYGSGTALTADNSGNIYVTGWYERQIIFGSHTVDQIGKGRDIFVAKLDKNGNWSWVSGAGGEKSDEASGIELGKNNNIYIAGDFEEDVRFGRFALESKGDKDIFVAKLNSVGNWITANQAGGSFRDVASDISIDKNGTIHLAGNYSDFVNFGFYALPGHNSNNDIFIATLDNNLNWTGVAQAGGWNKDYVNSISLSQNGSAYTTGQFEKIARFDTHALTGYGKDYSDIFVAKLSPLKSKVANSPETVPVKTAFYKDFLHPKSDVFWNKTNENVKHNLDTGKLKIINNDSELDYYSHEFFNLNPKGYYRIEAKIDHLSGVNNWGFGITWGLKDVANYNSFEISNDGSYSIYKKTDDTLTKIVDWNKRDILNIDKPNILCFEKSRTSVSFYINNNYICSVGNSELYNDFFGQKVGFVVRNNQTIEIDYLKISSNQGKSIIPSSGDLILFRQYYDMAQEHGFNPVADNYWDK